MARLAVNVGSAANDGTGDPLRTAFQKVNTNTASVDTDGLGYIGLPVTTQDAVYTFLPADNGKMIMHTEITARVWTIATFATQAVPIGAVYVIYNGASTGTITVTPAVGVTLLTADGTSSTGNRGVAADSLATIIKVATNTWIITGVFT